MIIMIIIRHYLNKEGVQYFAEWVNEARDVLLNYPGFIGIRQLLPIDAEFQCSIRLEFETYDYLRAWTKSEEHNLLVDKILKFSERPPESEMFHLK